MTRNESRNTVISNLPVVFSAIFVLLLTATLLGVKSLPEAVAMGAPPGSCGNEYDYTLKSFTIDNGHGTYDVLANPGLVLNGNNSHSNTITFTVHTAFQSKSGNTNNGSIWYSSDGFGYGNGECVYNVWPNQDKTVVVKMMPANQIGSPADTNGEVEPVYWDLGGYGNLGYDIVWFSSSNYPKDTGNSTITVEAMDFNSTRYQDNKINGLYMNLTQNGALVSKGYTPVNFTLNDLNNYTIGAADYGKYHFAYWLDQGYLNPPSPAIRPIKIAESTHFTLFAGYYERTSQASQQPQTSSSNQNSYSANYNDTDTASTSSGNIPAITLDTGFATWDYGLALITGTVQNLVPSANEITVDAYNPANILVYHKIFPVNSTGQQSASIYAYFFIQRQYVNESYTVSVSYNGQTVTKKMAPFSNTYPQPPTVKFENVQELYDGSVDMSGHAWGGLAGENMSISIYSYPSGNLVATVPSGLALHAQFLSYINSSTAQSLLQTGLYRVVGTLVDAGRQGESFLYYVNPQPPAGYTVLSVNVINTTGSQVNGIPFSVSGGSIFQSGKTPAVLKIPVCSYDRYSTHPAPPECQLMIGIQNNSNYVFDHWIAGGFNMYIPNYMSNAEAYVAVFRDVQPQESSNSGAATQPASQSGPQQTNSGPNSSSSGGTEQTSAQTTTSVTTNSNSAGNNDLSDVDLNDFLNQLAALEGSNNNNSNTASAANTNAPSSSTRIASTSTSSVPPMVSVQRSHYPCNIPLHTSCNGHCSIRL